MRTDSPTADAARHNLAEDRAHQNYLEYRRDAYLLELSDIRANEQDTVMDVFWDDPQFWLGPNQRAMEQAEREGDDAEVGRLMHCAIERVRHSLVTDERVNRRAQGLARENG